MGPTPSGGEPDSEQLAALFDEDDEDGKDDEPRPVTLHERLARLERGESCSFPRVPPAQMRPIVGHRIADFRDDTTPGLERSDALAASSAVTAAGTGG